MIFFGLCQGFFSSLGCCVRILLLRGTAAFFALMAAMPGFVFEDVWCLLRMEGNVFVLSFTVIANRALGD